MKLNNETDTEMCIIKYCVPSIPQGTLNRS